MITVRPAVPFDALSLAPRLREADRLELSVNHPSGTEALVLLQSIQQAPRTTWAADYDGSGLQSLFGVAPETNLPAHEPPRALVWMLGTDVMVRDPRPFLRESGAIIDELVRQFGTLYNVVDARNTIHIRWLKWCGFTVNPDPYWGTLAHPAHFFIRN